VWWGQRYAIDRPRVQVFSGFGEMIDVATGEEPPFSIVTPLTGELPVRGGQ
jgi:hypothetical protein